MNKYIYKIKSKLGRINPKQRADYLKGIGILNAGKNCEVYGEVSFGSEPYLIKIGDHVRITKGVQFITHDGGVWVIRNMGLNTNVDRMGTIKVCDNVFIGIKTIIMPGVTIGSNIIIGAGSLVTKDIPDNSVVGGFPAKIICSIEEYYSKNKDKFDDTKHLNSADKKKYYINKFEL